MKLIDDITNKTVREGNEEIYTSFDNINNILKFKGVMKDGRKIESFSSRYGSNSSIKYEYIEEDGIETTIENHSDNEKIISKKDIKTNEYLSCARISEKGEYLHYKKTYVDGRLYSKESVNGQYTSIFTYENDGNTVIETKHYKTGNTEPRKRITETTYNNGYKIVKTTGIQRSSFNREPYYEVYKDNKKAIYEIIAKTSCGTGIDYNLHIKRYYNDNNELIRKETLSEHNNEHRIDYYKIEEGRHTRYKYTINGIVKSDTIYDKDDKPIRGFDLSANGSVTCMYNICYYDGFSKEVTNEFGSYSMTIVTNITEDERNIKEYSLSEEEYDNELKIVLKDNFMKNITFVCEEIPYEIYKD